MWFRKNQDDDANEPEAQTGDGGQPTGAAEAGASDGDLVEEVTARLAASSREDLRPEQIKPDADLYEAGYADSLSVADFLISLEKAYGVKIQDWQIGGSLNSVERIAAHIRKSREKDQR